MKKVSLILSTSTLILIFGFLPMNVEAGCNPGHESSGKQSWGSNWSLVCDKSTMAICCTSRPSSNQ
ncbi:hypothetical protein [Fontibacter flavus]|uniref:Uncharacterized protein n=1 Tax=Fontibacter flavus TaxID=654838 RepID=A0ABV6FNN0_9BACT|nr:hypothetical protein [Cyclobacteriaceae bacterium]